MGELGPFYVLYRESGLLKIFEEQNVSLLCRTESGRRGRNVGLQTCKARVVREESKPCRRRTEVETKWG